MNIVFYFLCGFLVWCASMVVLSSHPIFSLVFLITSFICSSCLLLLLECEFIAIVFIVVYVGAIAVLFLFAIMMLETKLVNLTKNKINYFPLGFVFIVFLLIPLALIVNNFNFITELTLNRLFSTDYKYWIFKNLYLLVSTLKVNNYQNWYSLIDSTNDISVYSHLLYSYFILQFLISGFILLMVLIGVIYLTNSFEIQIIQQSSFKQLSRKILKY
jgi:NADH:ubiquinone oxidoreductase subunit 6 (subunit J)